MFSSILLVGCGKMGQALLSGWLQKKITQHVAIIDPSFEEIEPFVGQIDIYRPTEKLPESYRPDVIILAVKPQMMADILSNYAYLKEQNIPFISIAAGLGLAWFEERLSAQTPVIRVMPNTPSAISKGMSVLCAGACVTDAQKHMAETLMKPSGAVAWIEDEAKMDAVTVISGSGPAYFFYLVEALADIGEELGLSPELAQLLAKQTLVGAGALAEASSESCAQLRQNVTSKGGVTAEALAVMMAQETGLRPTLLEALKAGMKRSEELSV